MATQHSMTTSLFRRGGMQLQLNRSEWPSGMYYVHTANEIMGEDREVASFRTGFQLFRLED
jgi:hypothetical protein